MQGHLPEPRGREEPGLAGGVLAADRAVLRLDATTCAWITQARETRLHSAARRTSARPPRITPGPGGHLGAFIAWDAATGRKVWEIKEPFPVWSGALATAGDVVFYGTLDGWFKAVDAQDRQGALEVQGRLGRGRRRRSLTGPDGKQYVAVYAGIGGDWFLLAGDVGRTIPRTSARPPIMFRTWRATPARAAWSGCSGCERHEPRDAGRADGLRRHRVGRRTRESRSRRCGSCPPGRSPFQRHELRRMPRRGRLGFVGPSLVDGH